MSASSSASIVSDVLSIFDQKRDTNGNEYKLRYPPNQPGNRRYAEEVSSFFPTRLINTSHSRSDVDVREAFGKHENIQGWRAKYGILPPDTSRIVGEWVREQLARADEDTDALAAAACIVFASRSTVRTRPRIEKWNDLLFAAWRESEKCGAARLVPLLFDGVTVAQYEAMAARLPTANEWTQYESIDVLFTTRLGLPPYSLKGNIPRLLLVALMDRAETDTQRLAPLMAKLKRGRADLFNLVLGHISRSYLAWTYMGMLVRDVAPVVAVSLAAPAVPPIQEKENEQPAATAAALLAEKDAEIARLQALVAQLRLETAALRSTTTPTKPPPPPMSPAYSLSPLSSPSF
jgi:hypothetical protein